jgi:hypothetical protein
LGSFITYSPGHLEFKLALQHLNILPVNNDEPAGAGDPGNQLINDIAGQIRIGGINVENGHHGTARKPGSKGGSMPLHRLIQRKSRLGPYWRCLKGQEEYYQGKLCGYAACVEPGD